MSSPQPCKGAKKCGLVSAGRRCPGTDSAAAGPESVREPKLNPSVVPGVSSEWCLEQIGKTSGKRECSFPVTGRGREEGARSVWDVRGSVQNHRGMVWVGKHLRDHPGRSMGRDTSNQTRLLRPPSSPSLDTSRFGKFSLYLLIFIVGSIFITVLIKRLRGSSACARGNTRDSGSGTGCDAPQRQHFPPAASPGIQLKSS